MENRTILNRNLAQMLKGGVIMDVTTPEQAKIAEAAGACAVMALERIPADIRAAGRRVWPDGGRQCLRRPRQRLQPLFGRHLAPHGPQHRRHPRLPGLLLAALPPLPSTLRLLSHQPAEPLPPAEPSACSALRFPARR